MSGKRTRLVSILTWLFSKKSETSYQEFRSSLLSILTLEPITSTGNRRLTIHGEQDKGQNLKRLFNTTVNIFEVLSIKESAMTKQSSRVFQQFSYLYENSNLKFEEKNLNEIKIPIFENICEVFESDVYQAGSKIGIVNC